MANIRKTNSGKWKATVEMGRDPATGKRKRNTKTFRTKKECKVWIANITSEREKGIITQSHSYTLGEYLNNWLKDYAEPNLAATTYDGYRVIIKRHLIPVLGSLKLNGINPMHIQQYLTLKRKKGRKDGKTGGLAEKTLLQHFRVLSKALKQAVKWQLINYNPAKSIQAPKPKRSKEIRAMTIEQLKRLLETAKEEGDWIYNFIAVAAYNGMRRSELLGLRWEDVEFDNKCLRVRQVLVCKVGEGTIFKSPKTKSSIRTIKISNIVIDALKSHKKRQTEFSLQLGPKYNNEHNLVFSKDDGSKYYPTTINSKFNKITKKAGLSKFTLHDLRHTHATIMLKIGVNSKVVQERLGHSSITTTMDIYSHVTQTMQKESVFKFDEIMSRSFSASL